MTVPSPVKIHSELLQKQPAQPFGVHSLPWVSVSPASLFLPPSVTPCLVWTQEKSRHILCGAICDGEGPGLGLSRSIASGSLSFSPLSPPLTLEFQRGWPHTQEPMSRALRKVCDRRQLDGWKMFSQPVSTHRGQSGHHPHHNDTKRAWS